MARSTRKSYTQKTQFRFAQAAGELLSEIKKSSRARGERKASVRDERIAFGVAKQRRDGIILLLGEINESLPLLAELWSSDADFRAQVSSDEAEPIELPPAPQRLKVGHYAGMLSITSAGTNRFAEGFFDGKPIWAKPDDTTTKVIERYEAEAGALAQSLTWQEHEAQRAETTSDQLQA